MLVCGVQGCGKSLVSKATARVLGAAARAPRLRRALRRARRPSTRSTRRRAPSRPWRRWCSGSTRLRRASAPSAGRRPPRARLRRLPHVAPGAARPGLRRGHGERRRAAAARARAARPLRRGVLRRPALDQGARADPRRAPDAARPRRRRPTRSRSSRRSSSTGPARRSSRWSSSALFRAYAEKRELTDEHLRTAARELVPLATLYEEKIQALRQWGQTRARRASADRRTLDSVRRLKAANLRGWGSRRPSRR